MVQNSPKPYPPTIENTRKKHAPVKILEERNDRCPCCVAPPLLFQASLPYCFPSAPAPSTLPLTPSFDQYCGATIVIPIWQAKIGMLYPCVALSWLECCCRPYREISATNPFPRRLLAQRWNLVVVALAWSSHWWVTPSNLIV